MCILSQAAALHLAYAEYDDMSTLERIAILRGLCGLVLTTDAVRDVISARMDAISASLPKPKVATPGISTLHSGTHQICCRQDMPAEALLASSHFICLNLPMP